MKYIIEYLNCKKQFAKCEKRFKKYEDAVKWGRKNLSNFNTDMILTVLNP